MLRKWLLVFSSMVMIVGLVNGCTSSSGYQTVSVNEANEMIQKQNVQIIDVRTKEEFDAGHVPNSKLLPLQDIETWYGSLDPNQTYLMVCRSGNRSGQASDFLAKNGFTNVHNMSGGMNQWTFEIEK